MEFCRCEYYLCCTANCNCIYRPSLCHLIVEWNQKHWPIRVANKSLVTGLRSKHLLIGYHRRDKVGYNKSVIPVAALCGKAIEFAIEWLFVMNVVWHVSRYLHVSVVLLLGLLFNPPE